MSINISTSMPPDLAQMLNKTSTSNAEIVID